VAASRQPSSNLQTYADGYFPAKTPGPLGVNDRADPNVAAHRGDTPGSLGINDSGDPDPSQIVNRQSRAHISEARHRGTKSTKWHGKLTTGTARLTYYIFEGVMVGFVDSGLVHLTALSGGGGGSTKHSANENANNPYVYALKEVDDKGQKLHVHGGPIPPGTYQIHPPSVHPKLGLSARLEPLQPLPGHRGGFYIHGQGPHGSDGCIVPSKAGFADLMDKLKASKGGGLEVCQSMEGSFA
jgi:hypothetical protein